MKVIDLREISRQNNRFRIAGQYIDIEQPMFIYHSEEELDTNETGGDLIKIKNVADYLEFLSSVGLLNKSEYNRIAPDHNVWLKTIDEFIPDKYLPSRTITYIQNEEGNKIKTDSCWIRLYKAHTGYKKHFIYTSSGIWAVSINNYNFSAAVKQQYSTIDDPFKQDKEEIYRNRLQRLLDRKRASPQEIRLVHSLLNPISEIFLDFNKAMNKVYHGRVRKEDYNKVFTSKAFRSAVMSEIKTLFPGLRGSIQDVLPAKDIADSLKKMLDKALDKGTQEEQQNAIEYIIKLGYGEDVYITEQGTVHRLNDIKTISPQLNEHNDNDNDNDNDDDGDDMPSLQASESVESNFDEMEDDEREKLRDEHGYPDSFIMESEEEEKESDNN